MGEIAHVPAVVPFGMGEVERADAQPTPRQIEETIGGGCTTKRGEQPLQRGQRHDAGVIGIGEIPGDRGERTVENGQHDVVLVGQIRGIGRPHVMRGRIDVHRHE